MTTRDEEERAYFNCNDMTFKQFRDTIAAYNGPMTVDYDGKTYIFHNPNDADHFLLGISVALENRKEERSSS